MSAAVPAVRAPRLLARAVRLAAAIGALALASTGEMRTPVVVGFLVFFLIGMRVSRWPVVERVLAWLQPYIAAALFLVAVIDFLRVSQSFLLSVAHFLLGLQALRLLALRTARENLGSVLVSSLMMLSAATLAVDWTFFLMLLMFLPVVVWTLMLHTVVLESQAAHDRDLGQASLTEGTPAWAQLSRALRRAAAAAFFVTVACCAFVFLAFPRFNLQGFRGQFLQPVRTTGFTNQVDLTKAGKIFEDESVVMRIEIDPSEKDLWTGYVRGGVLDEFDGRLWRRAPRPPVRLFPVERRNFRIGHVNGGRLLHQKVYLESMDTPVLFAAPRLLHVRIDRPFLEMFADGGVQRPQGDAWRIYYEALSVVEAPPESRGGPPLLTRQEYLLCTAIPEPVASAARLGQEKGGRGTPARVAERLSAYLASNYAYSLTVPPSNGRHPIDNFLEDAKTGHCEYFASALCLMLRYRGIPSRMVTGFLSREWNIQGHYVIVRMRDAHAWVEYFDPQRGWTEIDPSPRKVGDDAPKGPASALRRQMGQAWDYLNLRWNRYILSYDIDRQVAVIRAVTSHSGRLSQRLERTVVDLRRWFPFGGERSAPKGPSAPLRFPLVPILAMAGAVTATAGAWRLIRGRRRDHVWFYRDFLRRLEENGARPSAGKTLREVVADVRPRLSVVEPQLAFLENEYYRLRFDPGYRAARGHRKKIRQALSALKG